MKAVVCTRYGPPEVLRLEELPVPVPRKHEVRIRIRATAVDREGQILKQRFGGALTVGPLLLLSHS